MYCYLHPYAYYCITRWPEFVHGTPSICQLRRPVTHTVHEVASHTPERTAGIYLESIATTRIRQRIALSKTSHQGLDLVTYNNSH